MILLQTEAQGLGNVHSRDRIPRRDRIELNALESPPRPAKSNEPYCPTAFASSPNACRTCAASRSASGSAPGRAKRSCTKPASPTSSSTWCSRAPRTARPSRSRGRWIRSAAGLDAFTSKELVSYNVKVLDEHLPEAFDVVADLVRNPLFEKARYREGKGRHPRRAEDGSGQSRIPDPRDLFQQFLEGPRAGPADSGHQADHPRFDRDKVEKYYKQFYAPSNILITAAGNLNHKRLVKLAEEHFADLKPRGHVRARRKRRSRTRRWCSATRIRSSRCTYIWACPRFRCRMRRASPATS